MANNVANRLDQFSGETQAASHLIATAAFQIGFVRLAVGMAVWSFEPDGLDEMKRRLAMERCTFSRPEVTKSTTTRL